MVTTAAYPGHARNPPGISFMGRKTWDPGRSLQTFITATFGVTARDQVEIIEQIGTAMAEVGPFVHVAMAEHPDFMEIGRRMLRSWQEGLAGLRDKRSHGMGNAPLGEAFAGFSGPTPVKSERAVIGRSGLLGKR